jgi:hypothetical protein
VEEFALHASFCMQGALTANRKVLKRADSVVQEVETQQLPPLNTPDKSMCRYLAYDKEPRRFTEFQDLPETLRKSGVEYSERDTRADLAARLIGAGRLAPQGSFLGLQIHRLTNMHSQSHILQQCSLAATAVDMGAQEEKDKQKASKLLKKIIGQVNASGFSGWDASKFGKKELQSMMLHTWQWTSDNSNMDKSTLVEECRRQIEQHWEELKPLTVEPVANTEQRRASCRRKLDTNLLVADPQIPTEQPELTAKRARSADNAKSTYIQERRALVIKEGWTKEEAIGILHGEA